MSVVFSSCCRTYSLLFRSSTNREAALSEKGIQQVQDVCRYFEEHNVTPTIVMYSLASSAMDTASIMGRDLKMGRDRLVPEFTYLDPRAVGRWDMLDLQRTQAAVWAMDQMEAGPDGKVRMLDFKGEPIRNSIHVSHVVSSIHQGARPPPHEDSTPNETLANQSTRLRQLVSCTFVWNVCAFCTYCVALTSFRHCFIVSDGNAVFW